MPSRLRKRQGVIWMPAVRISILLTLKEQKQGIHAISKSFKGFQLWGCLCNTVEGLRSEDHIRDALASGADRVMIGSLLFKDPDMPAHISSEFGPAAMPAIDIKHGRVVHSGWLEGTDITPHKAIGDLRGVGFSIFLVTDTERDGMMSGIRTEIYAPLAGNGCDIVAAGGITTVKDLAALAEIGISGAVIGKSLYEGGINLKDALDAVKQRELR